MLLGEIAHIYQPQTITGLQMSSAGKYSVYGANGVIGHHVAFNHATSQICIACRGNTCGALNYSIPFSWITGNSMVINVDECSNMVDKRYLFHLLATIDFTPLISGSGQPQIVRGPLQKLPIVLPTIEEQRHIATILDAMNERLKCEEGVLSAFQVSKRAITTRLFI